MKNYLRGAFKAFNCYLIGLVLFVLFIPSILIFATIIYKNTEKVLEIIHFYSFFFFVVSSFLMYGHMKKLQVLESATLEKNGKFYRGFFYGLFGMIPVILLVLVIIIIPGEIGELNIERIKHLAINTLLGPVYFIVRLGQEAFIAYVLAILVMPVVAVLGYMNVFHTLLGKWKARMGKQ